MRGLNALCLLTLAWPQGVRAQNPPDSLFVTGRIESVASANGGGGGIQWLRSLNDRSGLELGIFSGSLADTTLSYGRLGGYSKLNRWITSGAIDVGLGSSNGARFGYRQYKAALALQTSSTFVVESEAQRADLPGGAHVHVLRSTAFWQARKAVTVQMGYYHTFSASGAGSAVSSRADMVRGGASLFCGGVIGSHRSAFGPTDVLAETSREFFTGGQIRAGAIDLLGVIDLSRASTTAVRTLFGVRIPLASRQTP